MFRRSGLPGPAWEAGHPVVVGAGAAQEPARRTAAHPELCVHLRRVLAALDCTPRVSIARLLDFPMMGGSKLRTRTGPRDDERQARALSAPPRRWFDRAGRSET